MKIQSMRLAQAAAVKNVPMTYIDTDAHGVSITYDPSTQIYFVTHVESGAMTGIHATNCAYFIPYEHKKSELSKPPEAIQEKKIQAEVKFQEPKKEIVDNGIKGGVSSSNARAKKEKTASL